MMSAPLNGDPAGSWQYPPWQVVSGCALPMTGSASGGGGGRLLSAALTESTCAAAAESRAAAGSPATSLAGSIPPTVGQSCAAQTPYHSSVEVSNPGCRGWSAPWSVTTTVAVSVPGGRMAFPSVSIRTSTQVESGVAAGVMNTPGQAARGNTSATPRRRMRIRRMMTCRLKEGA